MTFQERMMGVVEEIEAIEEAETTSASSTSTTSAPEKSATPSLTDATSFKGNQNLQTVDQERPQGSLEGPKAQKPVERGTGMIDFAEIPQGTPPTINDLFKKQSNFSDRYKNILSS